MYPLCVGVVRMKQREENQRKSRGCRGWVDLERNPWACPAAVSGSPPPWAGVEAAGPHTGLSACQDPVPHQGLASLISSVPSVIDQDTEELGLLLIIKQVAPTYRTGGNSHCYPPSLPSCVPRYETLPTWRQWCLFLMHIVSPYFLAVAFREILVSRPCFQHLTPVSTCTSLILLPIPMIDPHNLCDSCWQE